MFNVGPWQRPRVYRRNGETLEQAYVREARAVRTSVGITDVSTLGKIDVQGPDAAIFLDRVYTNTFSTLPVGKARYGLMLRDDGFLYDDGTTWRLGENRYLMTTTTANGALVYQNLEMLLSIAWPELKVSLASLTDQWAGVAVSGPNSRALLEKALDDIDMSDAALPFMGVKAGRLAGVRGAGRAALFLGRARLRSLLRIGLRGRHVGAPAGSRQAIRGCALRPRSARNAPHREGPRHRRRDQRASQRPRSRPRKDVFDEEGFRRQAAGAPAGADRSRRENSSSAFARSTASRCPTAARTS